MTKGSPASADQVQPRVLVCDSGIGGLTVVRRVRQLLPAAAIDYFADDAAFPYGDWPEPELVAHGIKVICRHVHQRRPDAVVIACNTASTLLLPHLRARLECPVVGTVPAIKPAALHTRSGLISVLATPGTVRREYTRALIKRFAGHVSVRLVGAPRLAGIAEAAVHGRPVDRQVLQAEVLPCFVRTPDARTDVVVMACTHYPLLVDHLEAVQPWPVVWIDPATAIARRLAVVLGECAQWSRERCPMRQEIAFTTGRRPDGPLADLLGELGLTWT
jgi:glutamate racemase